MKARIGLRDASTAARIKADAEKLAQDAYDKEIRKVAKREAINEVKKCVRDADAVILWTLHDEFGFGKARLERFLRRYNWLKNQLLERYEFDDGDKGVAWYCRKELEKIGVNVDDTASDAKD